MVPYREIFAFVQHLAPTWRKTQQTNFAQVIRALCERENLALSDLARAFPRPTQRLRGRVKRLGRFLDNPRLDEAALFVRWLKLSYRLGEDLPPSCGSKPLVPLLLDTVYFEPFAMLVYTVPCGSRGLPVGLTTYHRQDLEACFPPRESWPDPSARRRASGTMVSLRSTPTTRPLGPTRRANSRASSPLPQPRSRRWSRSRTSSSS